MKKHKILSWLFVCIDFILLQLASTTMKNRDIDVDLCVTMQIKVLQCIV